MRQAHTNNGPLEGWAAESATSHAYRRHPLSERGLFRRKRAMNRTDMPPASQSHNLPVLVHIGDQTDCRPKADSAHAATRSLRDDDPRQCRGRLHSVRPLGPPRSARRNRRLSSYSQTGKLSPAERTATLPCRASITSSSSTGRRRQRSMLCAPSRPQSAPKEGADIALLEGAWPRLLHTSCPQIIARVEPDRCGCPKTGYGNREGGA